MYITIASCPIHIDDLSLKGPQTHRWLLTPLVIMSVDTNGKKTQDGPITPRGSVNASSSKLDDKAMTWLIRHGVANGPCSLWFRLLPVTVRWEKPWDLKLDLVSFIFQYWETKKIMKELATYMKCDIILVPTNNSAHQQRTYCIRVPSSATSSFLLDVSISCLVSRLRNPKYSKNLPQSQSMHFDGKRPTITYFAESFVHPLLLSKVYSLW